MSLAALILLAVFVVLANSGEATRSGDALTARLRARRQEESGVNRTLWITKSGKIGVDLLRVQAIIVKDEDVQPGCKSKGPDLRYASKRYLMCAGSILTDRLVLTSASCMHEVLHNRHNIIATPAVMIAPFCDASQVIKIAQWFIHPKNVIDPREGNYAKHNLAIAKLACKISRVNFQAIQLPTQSFDDLCSDENCGITVITKTGPLSQIMFETKAKIFDYPRPKREQTNSRSVRNDGRKYSKIIRSITRYNKNKYAPKNHFEERNKPAKKLLARSSDGTMGCPMLGSAVMLDKIQSAALALSCDDRQPQTPWIYTDLYDNLDWLNQMLGKEPKLLGHTGTCSTCIYNIYYGCDSKNPDCTNYSANMPVLPKPNCSSNHGHRDDATNGNTDLRMFNGTKLAQLKPVDQHYQQLVDKMYTNKNRSSANESVNLESSDELNDNRDSNTRIFTVSDDTRNVNAKLTSKFSQDQVGRKPDEKSEQTSKANSKNVGGYDPAYRQQYLDMINNESHITLKPDDLSTLEKFFKDNNYEDPGVKQSYLVLYNIFLEEQRQKSRNRHN